MKRSETSLADMVGARFGPYELVRRLGVGGMAETFVAIRHGPGGFTQKVCLKLVLPFFRDNADFIALFEREARLAATLRHRNIVGVIDFGEFEGTPYMALELVDGLDLRIVLDSQKDGRLPADLVALLGLELAEALEHAHNPPPSAGMPQTPDSIRGIVHRDISPSNVLISRQGEILLTDFGVAKAMTGASRKQSAVKGKVPYMSPEQLRAEPLDGRADLFALGVVLFEALAGERPYEGAHDPATIMLILKGEHPPLSSLARDAPPRLCEIIESLIEPGPNDRPETAGDLIEALADFAPSPRVRRDLGRLVTRLAEEQTEKRLQRTPSQPRSGTEVLPETDTGGLQPAPVPDQPAQSSPPIGVTPLRPGAGSAPPEGPASSPPRRLESPGGTSALPPAPALPSPTAEARAEPSPGLVRPPSDAGIAVRPARADSKALDDSLRTLRDERRPSPQSSAEEMQPRRRLWLALAGSLLGLGLAVSAALVFWPSSEASDGAKPGAPGAQPVEQTEKAAAPKPIPESKPSALEPSEPAEEDPAQASDQAEAESVTAQVEEALQPTPRADEPAPHKPRPATPEPDARAAEGPGRLTITVFPWGSIWINGQPWGLAPLKSEPMRPGTYKISVGQGEPTKTKTVRLRPGQRRTVSFDLSD